MMDVTPAVKLQNENEEEQSCKGASITSSVCCMASPSGWVVKLRSTAEPKFSVGSQF